jgi:tripartite-type tricarboxylate transporter receptor subunit TctC
VSSLGPSSSRPHLIKNVPYDALKDFDYLTVAVQAPNVLVVPAASPHKSGGRRDRLPQGQVPAR